MWIFQQKIPENSVCRSADLAGPVPEGDGTRAPFPAEAKPSTGSLRLPGCRSADLIEVIEIIFKTEKGDGVGSVVDIYIIVEPGGQSSAGHWAPGRE